MAVEGGYSAGDYADANAAAKASFDEIDSLYSKVGTNNATSNVRDAILQCCVTARSTGANLNAATQGSVDIWLLVSTLPWEGRVSGDERS